MLAGAGGWRHSRASAVGASRQRQQSSPLRVHQSDHGQANQPINHVASFSPHDAVVSQVETDTPSPRRTVPHPNLTLFVSPSLQVDQLRAERGEPVYAEAA